MSFKTTSMLHFCFTFAKPLVYVPLDQSDAVLESPKKQNLLPESKMVRLFAPISSISCPCAPFVSRLSGGAQLCRIEAGKNAHEICCDPRPGKKRLTKTGRRSHQIGLGSCCFSGRPGETSGNAAFFAKWATGTRHWFCMRHEADQRCFP